MPEQPETDPRVYMAAERTLLAWIRTGLSMMGFGFVVARFGLFLREMQLSDTGTVPTSPRISLWFGTALVLMGVGVNLVAAVLHTRLVKRLKQGTWIPGEVSAWGIGVAVALAVSGAAVAGYLLVFR